MVQKLAASAAVALLVVSLSSASAVAKGRDKKKDSRAEVPDSVSRQLDWEEKVVGPKEKGVDHKKIAAMQAEGRREETARQNQPPPRKTRAQGVAAPATATLPTMDIEKAAPAGGRKPGKRTAQAQEPPRQKDALDNLLAEESGPSKPTASAGSRSGLANVLASDDRSSRGSHARKARKKHRGN